MQHEDGAGEDCKLLAQWVYVRRGPRKRVGSTPVEVMICFGFVGEAEERNSHQQEGRRAGQRWGRAGATLVCARRQRDNAEEDAGCHSEKSQAAKGLSNKSPPSDRPRSGHEQV